MRKRKFKIGIVGATGYTGGELLRLALVHPHFDIDCVTSRGDAGTPISAVWSALEGQIDLCFTPPDIDRLAGCDLVFFATPHGVAMNMTPQLVRRGVRVVDLSADFRLKSVDTWERWYGQKHTSPEMLESVVYGCPELHRDEIRRAAVVANPGCYPTAAVLGLLPLVEADLIDPAEIIIDAKSGVSGAGRTASIGALFGEVGENFKAYGVDGHRHHPEIVQTLIAAGADGLELVFVPHLLPMFRGMQATIYARLRGTLDDPTGLYAERYASHPFVRVLAPSTHPDTRAVRGTNLCKLSLHVQPGSSRIIIQSVIDNLTKGAAGLAVQNANLMLGIDETTGLMMPPFSP